jgi:MFS family permease
MAAAGWLQPITTRRVTYFMLYSALFHIGLFGITDVILNFYFTSLGHNPETIGVLQSFPRIGGLVISLPIGLAANRLGIYRIILYSTFGMAFALLLPLVWPALPILALSRFLLGAFYGAQQIAINPFIGRLVDKGDQPLAFSYHNVITMAATGLGSFIGGSLPAQIVTHVRPDAAAQSPFAYGATLAIGLAVLLLGALPLLWVQAAPSDSAAVGDAKRLKLSAALWRRLLIMAIPMFFFGFTGGLTFPFYNLFFRTVFKVGDEVVGTILGIGWLGMGVVPLVNPWLDGRFGRARALLITLSLAAAAFFCLSIAPTLELSIVAFVIAISARNTMQPLFQPLVMATLPPLLHNMASSVGFVIWNIGWFCATAISGFLQAAYGFGLIMQVVAVGVLITGLSIVLIFNRPPTQQAAAVNRFLED